MLIRNNCKIRITLRCHNIPCRHLEIGAQGEHSIRGTRTWQIPQVSRELNTVMSDQKPSSFGDAIQRGCGHKARACCSHESRKGDVKYPMLLN